MSRLSQWFQSLLRPTGTVKKAAVKAKSRGINRRRSPFYPQLEALEDRMCPSGTTVLPISAFLAQQGGPGSVFYQNGGNNSVFTPPVIDELAWSNGPYDPGVTDSSRFLWADYTGQAAQYVLAHGGPNLNTTVTGFVTETPIGTTGLVEDSVNLEATNCLTWVASTAGISSAVDAIDSAPLELGCRPQDLVAGAPDQSSPAPSSLTPALSDVHLQLTWQEDVGAAPAVPPCGDQRRFLGGCSPPPVSPSSAGTSNPGGREPLMPRRQRALLAGPPSYPRARLPIPLRRGRRPFLL